MYIFFIKLILDQQGSAYNGNYYNRSNFKQNFGINNSNSLPNLHMANSWNGNVGSSGQNQNVIIVGKGNEGNNKEAKKKKKLKLLKKLRKNMQNKYDPYSQVTDPMFQYMMHSQNMYSNQNSAMNMIFMQNLKTSKKICVNKNHIIKTISQTKNFQLKAFF